jgi:hypothetical protein
MANKTRSASTVGALIKQFEKLPKMAKLEKSMKPVFCNTGETAKQFNLKPVVSFETH